MYTRKFRVVAAGVLFVGSMSIAVEAATPPQPGQLATAATIAPLTANTSAAGAPIVAPSVTIAQGDTRHDRIMKGLWISSVVAAIAGTSFDAASSWGKLESNGLLASSNGTFGAKGLSIKAGVAAGVIVPQILLRKHKELRTAFIIGNFGEGAIFSAAAIHNLGIQRP